MQRVKCNTLVQNEIMNIASWTIVDNDAEIAAVADMTLMVDDNDVFVAECIDWAAIHEREFAKMDSLDTYVKKREERRRRLKTPAKRAAAFAAKLTSVQQQTQADTAKVWTYCRPAVSEILLFIPLWVLGLLVENICNVSVPWVMVFFVCSILAV